MTLSPLGDASPEFSDAPLASPGAGARFVLRTFGRLDLLAGLSDADRSATATAIPLLQRGKPLALLAYCLAERRRAHSREALSALLWADAAPDRARHNVRQALWRLRRVLGELLVTRDDAVLSVDATVVSDREQFLEAAAQQDVTTALAVYDGPFLHDVSLPGGDEFDEWVSAERARLEDVLVRLVEEATRGPAPRLRAAECRAAVDRLLQVAPDSLEARRVAVDVCFALGDAVAARREADALEALATRLDRPLSSAAQATLARVRSASQDAAPTDDRASVTLELVGRDEPFAQVMAAWARARRGTTERVLLTGVAGVGKTRLLQAIGQRCRGRRSSVVSVRAHPGEMEVPFGYAALLARALAQQPGASGISTDSARELVALDPALANHFRVAPAPPTEGESVRRRALALLDLLQAVAEQQPLALVLDDLHWVDAASRQLLAVALGRLADCAVLVLGATRPSASTGLEHPALTSMALAPLEPDAVLEAIHGSGSWPEAAEVDQFIRTLAGACDGIPLNVVERLTLALDAGLLTRQGTQWGSPNWAIATREVAVSSPLMRRLRACADPERALLRVLAVAGTPLPQEVLSALPDALTVLRALEEKGFVHRESGQWQPAHDAIAEQLLADGDAASRRATHGELAALLVRSRVADRLPAALRHYLLADDEAAAATVFAQIVSRARSRGDRRPAAGLLADVLGEVTASQAAMLLRAVPWHQRAAGSMARVMVASALAVAGIALAVAWRAWRAPSLHLTQTAVTMTRAQPFGPDAFRLAPSAIVRVGTDNAVDSTPREIRVRSMDGSARIVAGATAVAKDGYARFGGLRLVTRDTLLHLRFEADGFRPTDLTFKAPVLGASREATGAIFLVEGHFGSGATAQRVRGPDATVRVAPGAPISGVVQMEYSAPWAAASVWVAVTPSWGDPATVGREVTPLTTPVRWDVVDIPVSFTAPTTPGRYWLLFVAAAEPSGGYILSNTNWSMNRAVWGDGNDVAHTSDSVIVAANYRGLAWFDIAYPETWEGRRGYCPPRKATGILYCPMEHGLFGIRVEVQ
ncbi:MAG: AAA family ATPase [Gemmatimonadaceae bacterium]|nr:AAA family ATPase [Gemmatimonadaceae bacterium]